MLTNTTGASNQNQSSDSGNNQVSPPSISLPKGGGAIRGIGEKFAANPVTGTGSMTVPIATSPGRSGFGPQLALSYDSGAGNGPFGFGWNLALPSITRRTDKGLPQYDDAEESDVFILSGSEDLVPQLVEEHDQWQRKPSHRTQDDGTTYTIQDYRPRIEGLFARIERWTNQQTGDIHWRSISKDNITTLYGRQRDARIADPEDASRIFSWLICESYDDKGNAIVYEYKAEDSANVDLSQVQERNRSELSRSANHYLKRVRYGNLTPHQSGEDLSQRTDMCFEVVFDYGEHDIATPTPRENVAWPARLDAFSTYRAGFEVRTFRLCRRVLMFHHFPAELIGRDCLVRSTDFAYSENPVASFIRSVTQSGYSRQAGNTYQKKSLPPLEFAYSQVEIDETIRTIDPESLENIPYGLDGSHYRWVDLDGEGISGILTEQGGAWFYKSNEGNATFASIQPLITQPSLANLSSGRQQLLDIAGDGHIALAQFAGPVAGFYERTAEDGWRSFQAFASLPHIDWADPNLRFIDVTGDGLADILITDQNVFTWYPSLRRRGFGPGERTYSSLNEERGPALVFDDGEQSIYLADMSGDGLADLVRIRNGEVCYWPNQGYGRFGTKVAMDNAPWFETPDLFDQRRLRLADIDGSGTTDIIYLGRNEVKLFFNQSGNSLSKQHVLAEFPRVDNLSSVNVVDLLGNGTAYIVWSSPLPGDARQPMHYIDLMGGQKPHLLIAAKNNMGTETRIQYVASTGFYLQDRARGTPWVTKLPFPVHVVERVETNDRVSNNRFVTRHAYHHGFYDGYEREFRGFGMVEQWDTEEIDALQPGGISSKYTNLDAASFVPPVHTKTWFHNGAYIAEDKISRHFVHEYYKEDALAILLPDTILPHGPTNEEQREASRALKGSILRQEIYADDGTDKSQHPYSVSERNYTIERVQPKGINRHAIFFVHARETIDYHYERIYKPAHDPRISHQFVLEVDEFGNVRKAMSIGYGRRNSSLTHEEDRKKQTQTPVTYTDNRFTNPILENDAYRTPLLYESRTYELTGHGYCESSRPTLAQLLKDVTKAAALEYQLQPDGSLQKRLIEHVRTLYRKDNLSAPLPPGTLESLALPYESYKQAFTPGLLAQVYGDRITEAMLPEGGYIHSSGDVNWWIPSGRVFYAPDPHASPVQELAFARDHFFLPHRFEDPFKHNTVVAYDGYNLLVTSTRDAIGNEVRAEYDYRVLQPKAVIDPNHNRSAGAFDTLGMLAGTAILGKVQDGQSESGDSLEVFVADLSEEQLQAFVQAPKEVALQLLDNATTRIIYDLDRFQKADQPVFAATLARENHVNAPGGVQSPVQVSFTYSDGFGREAETKIQAEPGDAPQREANAANPEIPGKLILEHGKPVLALTNPRWVGKGRTIYNNKGKPIKQYESFFSSTHLYEEEPEIVMTGVTPIMFYDPAERVVATLHPNHTYEKVVFDPWQQIAWDVNDTVLQADPKHDPDVGDYFLRLPEADYLPTWYMQRQGGAMGPQEQAAAKKAALHANTPTPAYLDTLGRTFLTVAQNRFERDEAIIEERYSTHSDLDIEGNQREVIDARDRIVMRYDYDMLSNRIHQASMEAGERRILNDIVGKPLYAWDSRGHRLHSVYDALRRPTEAHLREDEGQELLVGRTVYGETQAEPETLNLHGKVYQGFDAVGIFTTEAYDFKGNPLRGSRQLAIEYKHSLDWSGQVALETRIYTSSTSYDALNRPVRLTSPDNSVIRPTYNEANLLERLAGDLRGSANATTFVDNIDYNAKGQRTLIEYGNGVRTDYIYDPQTFRLVHLLTLRSKAFPDDCPEPHKSDRGVQNLSYTYDPIGNITHIRDDAQQTVYFRNRRVEPSADYTYDAIYRLIDASGREHLGQAADGNRLAPVPTSPTDNPRVGLLQPGDGNAMGRYLQQYVYDEVGNILKTIHSGTHPANPGWTRTYTYHQPSQLEPGKTSNSLSRTHDGGEQVVHYTYDVHGNMTSMPNLPLMQWDYRDQLQATSQQAVNNGGTPEITYYVYDATGQRVRKVTERQATAGQVPTRKAERIYLGSFEVYREYGGDGSTITLERETLHVMDDKQRIALIETRTQGSDDSPEQLTRYQFSNHLDSAVLELDDKANIISYEEYYPYGSTSFQAVRNQTETPKRYRYTGKERDEESGLYYYGARYYATWLGRWMSCDPAGMVDGVDLYIYARSSPSQYRDPNGYQTNGNDDEITRFIDTFEQRVSVIGKGLRETVLRIDIDETLPISAGGAPDDPANKQFQERLTNQLTKNALIGQSSTVTRSQISLAQAAQQGPEAFRQAASEILTRPFSEVRELEAITRDARASLRNLSRTPRELANAINRSIRTRIGSGTDPEAQLVQNALREVGINPGTLSALPDLSPATPSTLSGSSSSLSVRAGTFLSNVAQASRVGLAQAGTTLSNVAIGGARSAGRTFVPLFAETEDFLSQFGNLYSLRTVLPTIATATSVTGAILAQGAKTALSSVGTAIASSPVAAGLAIVGASGIGGAVVGGYVSERVEAATGSKAAGVASATLAGAGTGALIGAGIGSIIPGVGTAVGAVIGGAAGAVGGFIKSYW